MGINKIFYASSMTDVSEIILKFGYLLIWISIDNFLSDVELAPNKKLYSNLFFGIFGLANLLPIILTLTDKSESIKIKT